VREVRAPQTDAGAVIPQAGPQTDEHRRCESHHHHRIITGSGLGWKGPYRPSSSNPPATTRLLQAPSNLGLNMTREGAATASLGNLRQGLTTLTVNNVFLILNRNLQSFSFKPSPLVLSLQALVKSPSPALLQALQVLEGCNKVSLQPSLLQAEQPQRSRPLLTAEVLQPSDHCCGQGITSAARTQENWS